MILKIFFIFNTLCQRPNWAYCGMGVRFWMQNLLHTDNLINNDRSWRRQWEGGWGVRTCWLGFFFPTQLLKIDTHRPASPVAPVFSGCLPVLRQQFFPICSEHPTMATYVPAKKARDASRTKLSINRHNRAAWTRSIWRVVCVSLPVCVCALTEFPASSKLYQWCNCERGKQRKGSKHTH